VDNPEADASANVSVELSRTTSAQLPILLTWYETYEVCPLWSPWEHRRPATAEGPLM
jgi:hypothetical protein